MRRILKGLLAVFVGLPVLFAAGFIALALLAGVPVFDMPDCGPDSPAVARALALSQPELADLYAEMSSLVQRTEPGARIEPEAMPESFRALEPRALHVMPLPRVTMEGCFDHFVFMSFRGVAGSASLYHEPSIVLSWGEHDDAGSKVLWHPDS
jgi:hypothetical protein